MADVENLVYNNTVEKDQLTVTQPTLSLEETLGLPIEHLLPRLGTSLAGLSSEEAENRLEVYGSNELAKKKRRTAVIEFLMNFKSPLTIILLIAGLISGILQEYANAVIIFIIVLLSVILEFYQEFKAEKAAEALKEKVTTTATVLRDGTKNEIKLHDIVPGDIVFLSAGDIIPADARVLSSKDFFVNQSSLTGESFPVEKISVIVKAKESSITEWHNYLFMGTSIVSGTGQAVVVRTGTNTEYGKIAKRLVEKPPETEFERGIKSFGFLIMQVTLLLVLFVFLINALKDQSTNGILQALLFSVALAVGLTPELLPMIITMNLSKGAINMSKKGVIVKRLAAIENFGSMNVLCTDKTGTLTQNKIVLVLHVDLEGKDEDNVLLNSYINSYYQTGLKSPLDEAILVHRELDISDCQKIDEVPFDFVRRRVSVIVEKNRQRFLIAKGAPEEILKVSSFYELDGLPADFTDDVRRKAEQSYLDLSAEGFRVLGVCYKKLHVAKAVYSVNDENDMVFIGFVAFLDPPKETSKESLKLLTDAGIEMKILTGDNELVTKKTCEQLGFEVKGVALGNEIGQMTDEVLVRVVEEANVFARVTPAQKDRIISLLKGNGHIVGFMGDGINDAPSLKNCDVGVSVDNAVDVAKESADIILLKNDLTVLAQGVLEGRKTFGNTMKYVMMGVSSNFGNMFSVAIASLFLGFLPMLPIQILLNNLLYDISQSAITTDNVDAEYVEKPKRWDISFIRQFMFSLGPVSSLFDFLTFLIMILFFNIPLINPSSTQESLFQTAWFLESLATQMVIIFVIRTRNSPFWKSKPSKFLLASCICVLAIAMIIPFTPIGVTYFKFEPPPPLYFVFLSLLLASYIALAEIVKRWFYKRNAFRTEQVLIPKRRFFYISKNTRLLQDITSVICLRPESEISFNSLFEDLRGSLSYPIDTNHVLKEIQHLRRNNLISIDWNNRVIERESPLKEYVDKRIINSKMWPVMIEDWIKIYNFIKAKYNSVNEDYQDLFSQKE